MRSLIGVLSVLALAAPLRAQHDHSPYAGAEKREIKSLAPEQVQGLLAGEGLGYAQAAELNGVPGPKHVLELADHLELTEAQLRLTRQIFEAMQARAVELGGRLVEAERRLDRAFAAGTVDEKELATLVEGSARLEGELRLAHLQAHLRMLEILEPGQIRRYSELRGYTAGH